MSGTGLDGEPAKGGLLRGVVSIVAGGILLGAAYNAFGLSSRNPWGLSWIGTDKLSRLPRVESIPADDPTSAEASTGSSLWTDIDDPLAIPGSAARAPALPEIPAVGRPVQIELAAAREYLDAGAALFVDARDPDEYEERHIRGAINLPYERVLKEPGLAKSVDTGGRPIIAYCGGAGCEVSIAVAERLCRAGHPRVAVYVGGFPEWLAGGNPVESGAGTTQGIPR
jgi:rhodanese-related sulfurtransferase